MTAVPSWFHWALLSARLAQGPPASPTWSRHAVVQSSNHVPLTPCRPPRGRTARRRRCHRLRGRRAHCPGRSGRIGARRGDGLVAEFIAMAAVNAGILGMYWLVVSARDDVNWGNTIFFLFIISLLITLYDRYQPYHYLREEARLAARAAAA